jgi:hypothetical protein
MTLWLSAAAAALVSLGADIPVDPDADQARNWVIDELSKPEYQGAKPTWYDRLAQSIEDWLNSLTLPGGPGLGGLVPLLVVLGIVALIVVAFIVFGRPRLPRRSRVDTGALFGSDDARSAEELRASAERAAAAGDFTTAIEEVFRAIARGLAERTVVMTAPGTTAREFAARASAVFPAHAAELSAGGRLFDDVRYLERPGTRESYDRIATLDRRLQSERPVALESVGDRMLV